MFGRWSDILSLFWVIMMLTSTFEGVCGKIFMFARLFNFLFWKLCFVLAKRKLGCYNSEAL